MILGLLLICSGGFLYASDADEFRQRAKALRKEASELAERGNKEQAMRLERESVDLLAAAERLEMKTKPIGDEGRHAGIEKEVRHHSEMLNDLLAKQQKLKAGPESELEKVNEQIALRRRELHAIQSDAASFPDSAGCNGYLNHCGSVVLLQDRPSRFPRPQASHPLVDVAGAGIQSLPRASQITVDVDTG